MALNRSKLRVMNTDDIRSIYKVNLKALHSNKKILKFLSRGLAAELIGTLTPPMKNYAHKFNTDHNYIRL